MADKKVLVTGAAGSIGSYFVQNAADQYRLRLMVHSPDNVPRFKKYGEVVTADLGRPDQILEACRDIDTVLHLAGEPDASATWEELLPANIVGTYNLFVAAKAAGCRRVVYASSIHAVSGYPRDVQVKTHDPVNPGDLYGVTKCFGVALGRYMAEKENLSVIAVRIGAFLPLSGAGDPDDLSNLDAFASRRDLQKLLELCIEDDTIRFAIVHGISDNAFKRLDLSSTRQLLGYEPQDDFARINPLFKSVDFDEIRTHSDRTDRGTSGLRRDLPPDQE